MKFFNIFHNLASKVMALEVEAEQGIGELINVDLSRLSGTLKHMGIGMISIFIVIGVIIFLIYAMNKIMNRPKKDDN